MEQGKSYTDEELRRILRADRGPNGIIDRKLEEAYEIIRRGMADMSYPAEKTAEKKATETRTAAKRTAAKRAAAKCAAAKCGSAKKAAAKRDSEKSSMVKCAAAIGTAAAILAAVVGVGTAYPSLAREIPVLGSVLERIRGAFTFSGVPEEEIVPLDDTATAGNGGAAAEQKYSAADQGLTFTLTEYYASNQGITVGVRVESEKAFPEMAGMLAEPYSLLLQLSTQETYSFRGEDDGTVASVRNLEGRLADEHTFVGAMRIDYDSIRWNTERYDAAVADAEAVGVQPPSVTAANRDEWFDEYEVPDAFTMRLAIQNVRFYYKEAGKVQVRGDWTIPNAVEIRQSVQGAAAIRINDITPDEWGLESVEVSPTEITVHAAASGAEDVCAVVFDRDGRPLDMGADGEQFAVYGRDVSSVTIYLCDFAAWSGIRELSCGPDGTLDEERYRSLLEERAPYRKTLEVEQYLRQE